ncbi:hypothetical protein RND81_14G128100 [Saponaria officinalis]|uniref:Protein NO VEIN C-terminal domain-containing protein n=2 Tax=Saponaria officinalis TaxID=3572 RepID=A0AAW1GQ59_SAPOF
MSGNGRPNNHNLPPHFPSPPQQPPQNPNISQIDQNLLQNLNRLFPNPYVQNPNFRNFPPQNPNFPPNPRFLRPHQHQIRNINPNFTSTSNLSQEQQQQRPRQQPPQQQFQQQQQQLPKKFPVSPKLPLPNNNFAVVIKEKIDAAVVAVRQEMVAAGKEHISSWKVSQAALVKLKADSWDCLGFQMQEIASLHQLLLIEGKINAFIHCHVGAQRITTLYDLQEALCKNEGVDKFEDLELGPFLRQPLVVHYFSISNDVDEVYEITPQEVVSNLSFYIIRKHSDIKIEEFLEFIAKKCKVTSKEKLGVRIQSLGMHIGMLSKARGAQSQVLKMVMDTVKEEDCTKRKKKRPLFSLQKKELDERFSTMSERISSFASVNKDFRGQHKRFCPSSSDELDDVTDNSDSEGMCGGSSPSKPCQSSIKSKSGGKVSSCPYPSVGEEIARLGLRSETQELSSTSNQMSAPAKKKRKVKTRNHGKTAVQNSLLTCADIDEGGIKHLNYDDNSLDEDSIRMFVATWKDACREHTAAEVFVKMLDIYTMKKGRKSTLRTAFSKHPFMGLLNVAVTSIKRGMWDSMYDTFQSMATLHQENTEDIELTDYEILDIQPTEKDLDLLKKAESTPAPCVSVEDVVTKASEFLTGNVVLSGGNSLLDRVLMLVEQMYRCEQWLTQHFSVGEFKLLGHGDFLSFIGKHTSLLPKELLNFLTGERQENHPFEVGMIQHQLVMLLSQAFGSLWDDDVVTKEKLLELLIRQFPLISFKTSDFGDLGKLLDSVRQHRSSVTSSCVIFSATLSGTSCYTDPAQINNCDTSDSSELATDNVHKVGYLASSTSRDAIELLLRAPYLSDLISWSHWDLIYAPSLGPLVQWLLTEVKVKDLVCVLTRHGKIIRIDHSASGEMLFQAIVQESAFQVAVQLLSLFTISGGRRHVPLSLLKCQARQGFEVIMANSKKDTSDSHQNEKMFRKLDTTGCDSNMDLVKNLIEGHKAVGPALRVVIDCLSFLPSEFRCFAADVLLSGLRSLVKDVNSAVLLQCKGNEERLMLHEVGFGLGIIEWIDDHHTLCPVTDNNSMMPDGESSLISVGPDIKNSGRALLLSNEPPLSVTDRDKELTHYKDKSSTSGFKTVTESEIAVSSLLVDQNNMNNDAALLIESIRRDEFGLDSNLSDVENGMLKKQHARLGRALHCLSQELYSLDSHFLLELVQNADDNSYLDNVEPTLCFILQDTSIVILNNEQGFTAKNIRALCDIGNSTKKDSSAGYIGQKGIGFKSVFRITDAPEIHSNGFHIKFDISEGQIGFVLPTIIPPCDIQLFRRLASGGDGEKCMNSWNTCIVLPYKSSLLEGSGMSSISSMFLDLHPSLLLFLHRLRCIKLRNVTNDTYSVMRKEILGNGIVRVSIGEEKLTWFVASYKLHPKISRLNAEMTEISIAFTLEETGNGDYKPVLAQQPVFAFLPLRAYGLKFILQADFILPSSREEVDGDSPWNQWLMSEFPSLFVSAEKLFCALPCFQENSAKAVSAYLSFVPLVGEVHGFFSGLPRMILSKLRQSNCLLQDGCMDKWVAPCKVLRGWNEQAQMLLPDALLYEHLGLSLLHKDIYTSDTLARALGVEEYGPKILVQFISSLTRTTNGIQSMGLCWLISYLGELHNLLHTYTMNMRNSGLEQEQEEQLINSLKKVPFIPLSNGTYGSLDEGTIWFPSDYGNVGLDGEHGNLHFPFLYAKLRIVSPALFSAASGDVTLLNNCSKMLQKIGVQEMSAHELIRIHVLPSISDDLMTDDDKHLMIEYVTFVMLHLQSKCVDCHAENEHIISELRSKALILTNNGYKRPIDTPVHFSGEYGNSVDANRFSHGLDYKWHEVDKVYLDHPATKSISSGLTKWREFLQMLGVTDFVKVVVAEKSISDLSSLVLDQIVCDRRLVSPGLVVRDWESPELVRILSLLSEDGNQDSCRYVLEALDALWDDHFSDKVSGCCVTNDGPSDLFFKTSLLSCICDTRWVVSSVGNELHYPRDLFYECNAVRSILGVHAPYAVPKIKSVKFLNEIGFKTQVTLDDALSILQTWSRSESTFTASLSQMSKLYSFIWKEMAIGRQQAVDVFSSGPFIFVPNESVKFHEDIVAGVFLSPAEVYWRDTTGALECSKDIGPSSKTLCTIYPGLHDFFVNECGVNEAPLFHHYLQILQELSRNTLPLQSANTVFQILLKWSDGLSCGMLCPDDLNNLKECLSQLEFTVLPAIQDKWVSLHPSFGLICWCDDDDLKKEFKYSDNIEFLYFGELANTEKESLQTKVSALLKNLGIPALSEVVTREAIYYGHADPSVMISLIEWVLPSTQLYLYNLHPENYNKLKQSGFSALHELRVIVVQQLFCRNVIKKCECSSKKRSECKSLLQGNILYTTCLANPDEKPEYHSVFMELSRLFFDGTPELHLANFLLMITSIRELNSSDEPVEHFILNSQNLAKLPVEESTWSFSLIRNDYVPLGNALSENPNDHNTSRSKKKTELSSWPPADWKTAPGFEYARQFGIRAQPAEQNENLGTNDDGFSARIAQENKVTSTTINVDIVIEDDGVLEPGPTALPSSAYQFNHFSESSMEPLYDPAEIIVESFCPEDGRSKSNRKDQVSSSAPGSQQAVATGRQGEHVAFKYFSGKVDDVTVNWVNQDNETGFPYDIVIGDDAEKLEYIEVKTSRYARKDWFEISTREWQFAAEKGDSFRIAHVILSGQNQPKIVVYKNPVKLCQQGKLQLAVMTPRIYQGPPR